MEGLWTQPHQCSFSFNLWLINEELPQQGEHIYAFMHLCIYAFMHLCIYAFMHLCIFSFSPHVKSLDKHVLIHLRQDLTTIEWNRTFGVQSVPL